MSERFTRRDFLRLMVGAGAMVSFAPALRLKADAPTSIEMDTPPTLMLHTRDRWKLDQLVKLLNEEGYTSINYAMLLSAIEGKSKLPARPVILSIDDLGASYIQPYFLEMADVIEGAGHRGVFGVVVNEAANHTPKNWARLRELSDRGWEMDSHTCTHRSLPRITTQPEMDFEIIDSVKRLEDGIGKRPIALLAPYGNVYSHHRLRVFDERLFETTSRAGVSFIVGIVEGRKINSEAKPPYYTGRIGPGDDHLSAMENLKNFQSLG